MACRVIVTLLLVFLPVFPGAAGQGSSLPPPRAKCPVCGMFVARYPDWAASVTFRDGSSLYFDGPKDLFTFYLNPGRYVPGRKQGEISAVSVKDYYSLTIIGGERAFYVLGSNVLGPMGRELVPFARLSDAEGFAKDHGGKRLLLFGEVTPKILKELE